MKVFGVDIPFTRVTSPRGPNRYDYQESCLSSKRLLNEIKVEKNEISCSKNLSQKIIRSFSPRRINRSCESLDDETKTNSWLDDKMNPKHDPNIYKGRKHPPKCPSGGQKDSRNKTNRSDDQKLEHPTTSAIIHKGVKLNSGHANDIKSKEQQISNAIKGKDVRQNSMNQNKRHIRLSKTIDPVERKKCPSVSITSSRIPLLRKEKCPKVEKSERVERKIEDKCQSPRSTSAKNIPGYKMPLGLSQKCKSTTICSTRTSSKENLRDSKLKSSFDETDSTDIIKRINRELAIMGVDESRNKNAPDSGIWSLSSTNSDTENSKGNLVMCAAKKGDNTRKVEMKSAKITKNLKLCSSRKCSSSVESSMNQVRSGTRKQLITIESELPFNSREDSESQSEVFRSFSTTNESIDNSQNSLVTSNVPAASFKNFILQSPRNQLSQTSVDEVRKLNANQDKNERILKTITEKPSSSRCSSNSSKEYLDKLPQRNKIGIPISTQAHYLSLRSIYQSVPTLPNSSKEISDINNHIYKTIISNKPLSTSSPLLRSLVAADDVSSAIHFVKPDASTRVGEYSSPSSIPVCSPFKQLVASKKVSRKNPYTLCYKMSTSFLTNKVSEKSSSSSSGLYAKMTPGMNTDDRESLYSSNLTLKQPSKIKENATSKLVEICNEVHNYPESTEACGAYPASLLYSSRNGLVLNTISQPHKMQEQPSNTEFYLNPVIGGEISSSTMCPNFENMNKARLQMIGPHSLDSTFLQQRNEREKGDYSNSTPGTSETTSQLYNENPCK